MVHGNFARSRKTQSVWLFCYPKNVGLFREYAQAFEHGKVECILWIGPMADHQELEELSPLATWTKEVLQDCGLGAYETMAAWRRRGSLSNS